MDEAREEILAKLKEATRTKKQPPQPDFNQPIFPPLNNDRTVGFKKKLEAVKGTVHICKNENDLFNSLDSLIKANGWNRVYYVEKQLFQSIKSDNHPYQYRENIPDNIEVGITSCEFLIAHTGSFMVSSKQGFGRQMFVFPPVHIVIAYEDQLVDDLEAAYSAIVKKYGETLPSMISLITGPSRTADIEKTLVLGAHGPKELYVFILKGKNL